MSYYPILIDLSGRKALVVGGGKVALRKVETLIEHGADVTVVAPDLLPELERLGETGDIKAERRSYATDDLTGAAIVIAATDDREVNVKVSEDARRANIPVNVVDVPDLCTFIVPASVRRGDLTISISTAGSSPARSARRVREQIEGTFGPEYGELSEIMREVRRIAREQVDTQPEREALYKKILDSEILNLLRNGRRDKARELAMSLLRARDTEEPRTVG